MITVSKSKLKARMLEYFRLVETSGEEIVVTDRSKPVLKIVPLEKKKTPGEVFENVQGLVKYRDDILKPDTEEWGDI